MQHICVFSTSDVRTAVSSGPVYTTQKNRMAQSARARTPILVNEFLKRLWYKKLFYMDTGLESMAPDFVAPMSHQSSQPIHVIGIT
jgi:hypothetical protein